MVNNYGWIKNDNYKRKFFKKAEIQKIVLKSLMISNDYPIKYRYFFNKIFYIYSKKSAISSYKRGCIMSHWGRSIFRDFKLSRHFTKRFASDGFLLGLRKSSF